MTAADPEGNTVQAACTVFMIGRRLSHAPDPSLQSPQKPLVHAGHPYHHPPAAPQLAASVPVPPLQMIHLLATDEPG